MNRGRKAREESDLIGMPGQTGLKKDYPQGRKGDKN
jgi:hypothetical protein